MQEKIGGLGYWVGIIGAKVGDPFVLVITYTSWKAQILAKINQQKSLTGLKNL